MSTRYSYYRDNMENTGLEPVCSGALSGDHLLWIETNQQHFSAVSQVTL